MYAPSARRSGGRWSSVAVLLSAALCLLAVAPMCVRAWTTPKGKNLDFFMNECGSWGQIKKGDDPYAPRVESLQYMLNEWGLCSSTLLVDGDFGSGTEACVETYQAYYGLSADGVVGSGTWSSLANRLSVETNDIGEHVKAVQTWLNFYGYDDIPVSGTYDADTSAAVQDLYSIGGYESSNSGLDQDGWKIFISGCNTSVTNNWGLDLSHYQGDVPQSEWQCLHDAGFTYAVILGVQQYGDRNPYIVSVLKAADAAGFEYLDVYFFPQWKDDASTQVTADVQYLWDNNAPFTRVWFDFEGDIDTTNQQNNDWMIEATETLDAMGVPWGIYSSASAWEYYLGLNGDFKAKNTHLWYARYDYVTSFNEWKGWPKDGSDTTYEYPTIKQYRGTWSYCGTAMDLNWSPWYPCLPEDGPEVCGTDDVTYPSECVALWDKATVKHSGPCGAPTAGDGDGDSGDGDGNGDGDGDGDGDGGSGDSGDETATPAAGTIVVFLGTAFAAAACGVCLACCFVVARRKQREKAVGVVTEQAMRTEGRGMLNPSVTKTRDTPPMARRGLSTEGVPYSSGEAYSSNETGYGYGGSGDRGF